MPDEIDLDALRATTRTTSEEIACPTCGSRNARVGLTWSWLMGWGPYIKDGATHSHDPNRRDTEYTCDEGHTFHRYWWGKCPACGETEARGRDGIFADNPTIAPKGRNKSESGEP